MRSNSFCLVFALSCAAVVSVPAAAQEILPFPPKPSGSIAGPTMQEFDLQPATAASHLAEDAPNILIVLIDDVGPAQTDTFGGEIHTPTLSRIAEEGIAYNRFHTTAMCSPTRAALLTGRNHHRVASGQITELANDWDGYIGHHPEEQRHGGRGAQGLRLQHRGMGQMAQHPRRPDDRVRALRLLADRLRLSNISTAFLPARHRSTSRCSCATRPMSSIPTPPAATIIII